jgi:hypothetical protein
MTLDERKYGKMQHDRAAANSGIGANALWDGPLDTSGLPKGKGSSSGKNGMVFNNDKPMYDGKSITQRAKCSHYK